MNEKKKSIIQQVAEQNGTEAWAVRKNIEQVWDHVNRDQGSLRWQYWQAVQKKGERPTAEEMIHHAVSFYYVYQLVLMENGEKLSDSEVSKVLDMAMEQADLDQTGEAAMRAVIRMQTKEQKENQVWRRSKS